MRLLNSFLFSALCVATLIGCGGGSGDSSSAAAQETGQVTVLVGDRRAIGWDHVWITFSEIRFIGGGGQSVFVMEESKELDLLALENYTERLVPARDIVTGPIRKIRFVIDDVLLERTDRSGNPVVFNPPIPPGFKIDLLLRNAEVRAGEKLVLEVDVDLRHSLHRDRRTGGWRFRPVFKARASTEELEPRLMRLEGDVDGLVDGKMRVCNVNSVADRRRIRNVCILMQTDQNTSFHKGIDDGRAVVVEAGDHIVAYGLIDMTAADDTLMADVVAVGDTFVRMKGEALTMVADSVFGLDIANEGEPIPKQVGLMDGARLFDSVPKEVNAASIAVGNYLESEGFGPAMDGDPDVKAFITLLNHEVIVVDGEPTPTTEVELEQVTGEIQVYGAGFVTVLTDAGVQDCVMYTAETEIIDIDSSGTETVVSQVSAPTAGSGPRLIDAWGLRGGQCLDASTIVVE